MAARPAPAAHPGGSMRVYVAAGFCAAYVLMLGPSPAGAQRLAPAFSARDLTALPTTGWITNGGNVYNQRYSPLTAINKSNVAGLKPKWRIGLRGSGTDSKYSGQAQPLV